MSSRISLAEAVIVLIIMIILDFFDFMLTVLEVGLIAVFGIGLFGTIAKEILNFFSTLATQIYLFLRGIRGFSPYASSLVGDMIKFIPLVNVLPTRTISMAITIVLANKSAGMTEATPVEAPRSGGDEAASSEEGDIAIQNSIPTEEDMEPTL